MKKSIDIIGDIAIIKFHSKCPFLFKRLFAWFFLKKNKNIKTVLEKTSDIKGRLRKFSVRFLAGENKRETIHKENNCLFFLNVENTYFSPRLSEDRKFISEEISREINQDAKILAMFAGIAPYPIVLAKTLKSRGIKAKIISSEINRKASKYALKNVKLNKLEDYIQVIQGDSRKLKTKYKFDVILMLRPNLKETFLDSALKYSKKGTIIYYHGFGSEEKVLKELTHKKIKILYIRKAGDIAPRKWRWLAKLKVI
ncbi:MAG: hypothetical protein QW273_01415 [Candidatus Pacearchaeota archaeon]